MTAPGGIDRKVQLHRLGAPTAALLILALLPVAFVACGGGGGDSTSSQASAHPTQGRKDIRDFGSEASGSRAEQAETVTRSYFAAVAAGKWSRACAFLTKSIRHAAGRLAATSEQADGASCAAYVASTYKQLPSAERTAEIDVSSVRLDGDRGYVIYSNPDRGEYAMPVENEAGRWLGASPVGTSLEA